MHSIYRVFARCNFECNFDCFTCLSGNSVHAATQNLVKSSHDYKDTF